MKRQLCCLLLALCLFAAACPSPMMADPVSLPAIPDSGSVWDGSFTQPSRTATLDGVDYYVITEASEMAFVAHEGGDWLARCYVLGADLILNDITLTWDESGNPAVSPSEVLFFGPIGGSRPFSGVFDGNGHTISGLIVSSDQYAGLFGNVYETGVVRGVTVTNSFVNGGDGAYIGGIAGYSAGIIENCRFSGHVKGSGSYTGGVAGLCTAVYGCENYAEVWGSSNAGGVAGRGTVVSGCANYGAVHGYGNCTGGIAGMTSDGGTVENCENHAEVFASDYYSTDSVKYGDYTGGIVGQSYGSIRGCSNDAAIRGYRYIGGIAGGCDGEITGCSNSALILSNTGTMGGIAGRAAGPVSDCRNSGEVIIANSAQGSCSNTGGIAGTLGSKASAARCVNEGVVYGCGYSGGIAGYAFGSISDCSNSAEVYGLTPPNKDDDATAYAGGIAGCCGSDVSIMRCANHGRVEGVRWVGGITGSAGAGMSDCYSLSDVLAADVVGGLAGRAAGSMSRCYSGGAVWFTGDNTNASGGGIMSSGSPTASDCYFCPQQNSGYWDASGSGSVSGCTAVSDADLRDRSTFRGWDFDGVWAISPDVNGGYPRLAWEDLPYTPPADVPPEDVYRVNGVTARSYDGAELPYIPAERFLATVSVTKLTDGADALVFLAAYDRDGAFRSLMFFSVEDVPSGGTVKVTLPVDNSDGSVARLKAFPVASFSDMTPLGPEAAFPG